MQTQQKAIILARVSSKSQEDEGYSLDSQLKLLREYCKKNGLVVDKEFKITETASKNQRRTIFKELIRYVAKNKISHFVVEKTDRLTRNFKDAVVIDGWLEGDENRRLHMVKESLVLHKNARSDAKFMWSIYLSVAKKYTDNLREEAMKGWAEKLAQGWLPATPPPGYKTVIENGKRIHVPDPERAQLIRLVFDLYCMPDQTITTIAAKMAELGILSSKGRPLSKSNVHARVLDNPFYIGVNRFNGQDYPGAQEPIVSKEVFDAAQQKLHAGRTSRRNKHNPLFRGLIKCAHCGYVVTWQSQKGYFYGVCRRMSEACQGRKMLRQDRVEEFIIRELENISDPNGEILKKLQAALQLERPHEVSDYRDGMIKSLQAQLARQPRIEERLYEDKLAGLISAEQYRAKVLRIAGEAAAAQERLAKLYEAQGIEKVAAQAVKQQSDNSIADLYLKGSTNHKRIIVTVLFGGLKLDGERLVFKVSD